MNKRPLSVTILSVVLIVTGAFGLIFHLRDGSGSLRGEGTVLLVEDQAAVRKFVKAILTAHGYQVLEASGGAEAQAVAGRHSGAIDLLLTDFVMPGMNGRDLSRQLRELHPNLKVILMFGYSMDRVHDRESADSDLTYIQKPFDPDELAAKVREALAG